MIVSLLAELDAEAHLRAAGLTDADLAALRARLVGQRSTAAHECDTGELVNQL